MAALIVTWRADPVLFARQVFGINPWELPAGAEGASQADVLRALPTSKSIAWRSGHKVGKSTAAAIAALWFYVCWPGARVVLTAPTARQIREVVWREVKRLWKLARKRGFPLGGRIGETYSTGIQGPGDRQVFGIATDDQDRFSGVSGNVFYIVDEGSGVEDPLWEALEGNRAGGAKVLTLGNPTRVEGAFFRAFHEESELWTTFWTPSESTPTAKGTEFIPHLANADWIRERRIAWFPHASHPLYAIRVRGDFPAQGADSVFSLAAITKSIKAWRELQVPTPLHVPLPKVERLCVGFDCARFGDDLNAVVARRGKRIVGVWTFAGKDSIQAAAAARALIRSVMTPYERGSAPDVEKPLVLVDEIGIGAGTLDQMRTFPDLEVLGVNVAQKSDEDEQYSNLRAQLWFGASSWVNEGGVLPDDPRLRADLLAPRYAYDLRGRLKVESKEDLKERIGRSPDLGDAFVLCCYTNVRETTDVAAHVAGL